MYEQIWNILIRPDCSDRPFMYYRADIDHRSEVWKRLTLRLLLLAAGGGVVSTFLHGAQDVFVIRVQVMVKTQEVKLGVTGLLGFQDDLKLGPLLAHEVGRPLDDVVSLDGRRLQKRSEVTCLDWVYLMEALVS